MDKATVSIRPAAPGDTSFIISTWLRSYKHSSYFAKRIRNSIFFKFHHQVVSRILADARTSVTVACDVVDPNVIYGYLVTESYNGEDTLVQYVYVKSAFRKMGIARSLVSASTIDLDKFIFSHWTFAVDGLIDRLPGAVYIPYLI